MDRERQLQKQSLGITLILQFSLQMSDGLWSTWLSEILPGGFS